MYLKWSYFKFHDHDHMIWPIISDWWIIQVFSSVGMEGRYKIHNDVMNAKFVAISFDVVNI